jgi:hypothetical protein
VSTTEELLGTKSYGSGLEIREFGRRAPLRTNFADKRRSLGVNQSGACSCVLGPLQSATASTKSWERRLAVHFEFGGRVQFGSWSLRNRREADYATSQIVVSFKGC